MENYSPLVPIQQERTSLSEPLFLKEKERFLGTLDESMD
jgi:hypothetical protein